MQPNAWQPCKSALQFSCSGTWCDYCGGEGIGACCNKGDSMDQNSPCNGQPAPDKSQVCVHTECQQDSTAYNPGIDSSLLNADNWAGCQRLCQLYPSCFKWTFFPAKSSENCRLSAADAQRVLDETAVSGPKNCPKQGSPDTPIELNTEELNPCEFLPSEKGAGWDIKDKTTFKAMMSATKKPDVIKCYEKLLPKLLEEFNPLFLRFLGVAEALAAEAGCFLTPDAEKSRPSDDKSYKPSTSGGNLDNLLAIDSSDDSLSFGSFAE